LPYGVLCRFFRTQDVHGRLMGEYGQHFVPGNASGSIINQLGEGMGRVGRRMKRV
jgi:hypothetical protein